MIELVHAQDPDLPVIIVTGTGSETVAVEALKMGAADYVIKTPDHIRRLPLAIHAVLEKRQASRALHESRAQMAGIFSTMMDALITIDEDQKIVAFNPAAEQMYRCKAVDVIGQPLDRFLPDFVRSNHAGLTRRFAQSNSTARTMATPTMALPCLRADGEAFASEISISHVEIDGKKLFTAIVRDVTERNQAEQQMRLLTAALEAADNSIVITDRSGTIQWANLAWSKLTGYSLEEAIGQNPRILKSGVQTSAFYQEMWETILAGDSWRGELINQRKDGSLYAEQETITPVRDTDGTITHFVAVKEDITERKQAAEALANERNLLRTLIDHLPDSIYAKDTQGRFVLKNVAGARLLGATSPEAAIGKTDSDFYAPEMAAGFWVDDQTVISSGQSVINREELVTGATGQSSWVSTTKVPWRDPQGNIIGLVGIGHDITESKRAQARIETQMHRLAALHAIDVAITSTSDLTQTLDVALEQTLTHLDLDAACVLLVDSSSQTLTYVTGQGFRTTLAEDKTIYLGQGLVGRAILEGRMVWAEDASQIQDSPRLSALWAKEGFAVYHGVPLIAKDRIVGLMEVFRRTPRSSDAEWRSFLETLAGQAAIAVDNATLLAETQAQAQLTQQIIDNAPEGMVLLDRAQRLVLANPTALVHLADLAQLAPGDLVTTLGDHPLSTLLETRSNDQARHELILENSQRMLEVAVQRLTSGPHTDGTLLVIWDVTAERERQRYQQAQERLASVGQLAAGIAHDFNNIMGAIVLYAQLLSKAANLTDRQRGQLLTIQEQAKHATNLIRQILDFSRRSFMQKISLDLAPLVKEMVKLLERTMPENIRLGLTYDRSAYIVFADPTQVQQVLMNLAFNARDAMPNGGELGFTLSILSLASGEAPPLPDMGPGEWISLVVSDTGTGIDPTHLSRIFDPFFTTKEPGKGTGLGLAQVYGIVKQHGGTIVAESQLDQGATFTLYLPQHSITPEVATTGLADEIIPGRGETILLVEDNKAMRQSVQGALEELGYGVLVAEDGRQALEIIDQQAKTVSLMLSDLVMPEMGGIELAHIVLKRFSNVKVLIMTGHPLGEGRDDLPQSENAGWIRKPFAIAELAGKIRSILDGIEPGAG